MTEDELNHHIDRLRVSDIIAPNSLVKPFPFLIDYAHICSYRSRLPLAAQILYIEGDDIGRTFQNGFFNALDRGLDAEENIDAYVTMITNGQKNTSILKDIREGRKNSNYSILEEKRRLLDKFQEKGGRLNIINPPKIIRRFIPQARSNHMKVYFGDNLGERYLYAGKVNISIGDFEERPDFLVKYTDPGIISAFETIFIASKTGTLKDMSIPCNTQTVLHIDAGRPLSSYIQKRVSEAILSSKISVEGVEPFFPDLVNLLALNKANRRDKVFVDIVCSDPNKINDRTWNRMATISRSVYDKLAREEYVSVYPGWVHAALRILDRKTVIFTTHNLSLFGTLVGTAEWALETTDPQIVSQCVQFFNETKTASTPYNR